MDSPQTKDHIIICGLGHVGCRVARLYCRLGKTGYIITQAIGEQWHRENSQAFQLITGNARDERLLKQAGIDRATVLLALTNDDLANVDICLEAKRLNPKITVIARLFDQDLAEHLERSLKIDHALSPASIAVPAFVAAVRGSSIKDSFQVADSSTCLVEECLIAENDQHLGLRLDEWEFQTGRRAFALQEGSNAVVFPQPSQQVRAGMRIQTLVLRSVEEATPPKSAKQSGLRSLFLGIKDWWSEVPRGFQAALIALISIMLFSIVLFHLSLGLSWVDSLYFVVTTITTVGYGDFNLMNAPSWLKIYGAFLMLCSAGLLATVYSIVTNLMIEMRLRDLLARGCSEHKGHLIVVGLGSVGLRLVEELVKAGESVVAVEQDRDGRFVPAVKLLAPVVHGNARTAATLDHAGLAGAKALVTATSMDIENLAIGLAVKRRYPEQRVVLRMFDSKLADSMGDGPGIDTVLSVSTVAAPSFVAAGLHPDFLKGLLLDGALVVVFFFFLGAASPLIGKSFHRLSERSFGLWYRSEAKQNFRAAPAGHLVSPGEEILGVEWHPFVQRAEQP